MDLADLQDRFLCVSLWLSTSRQNLQKSTNIVRTLAGEIYYFWQTHKSQSVEKCEIENEIIVPKSKFNRKLGNKQWLKRSWVNTFSITRQPPGSQPPPPPG
ncbi:uncharacterized protein LOC123257562 [Drosophila ananassae]|uniref:uncharacterized protein LOC123257562 n=1 Tax=Drosophila ananassae TaxID=7217 RepID=UPI001CFFE7A8|nr:uncharacterized protein LOC123257562 [Drosophila ananassae]